MITGMHALIYSADADADRAFLRDVLGWRHIEDHPGWLIFALPPGEVGVHPAGDGPDAPRHELHLMCDDLDTTVRDLAGRGATFAGDVVEAGYGRQTYIVLPSGGRIGLYQPRHRTVVEDTPL